MSENKIPKASWYEFHRNGMSLPVMPMSGT